MGYGAFGVRPPIRILRPHERAVFGKPPYRVVPGCPREDILASQRGWIFQQKGSGVGIILEGSGDIAVEQSIQFGFENYNN